MCVKIKVHPRTVHEVPDVGVEVQLYSFFNLGTRLAEGDWSTPYSGRFIHCTGDWAGPRANLDMCGKSLLYWDSIPGPSGQ